MNLFRIKEGYRARTTPVYFEDALVDHTGLIHQPDVYEFTAQIGRLFGCKRILDIGCGRGHKLSALHPRFLITGIDHGQNIAWCRRHHEFGNWIEHDLVRELPQFPPDELRETAIICSDVIEHLVDPSPLLWSLRKMLNFAPAAVVSTPERDRVRGTADFGPPANPAHIREWNLAELQSLLVQDLSFNLAFIGLTRNNDRDNEKKTQLAVLHRNDSPRPESNTPASFRVIAFMTAYNEVDFLEASITHLHEQGVDVHLIDNWSTDGTFELAQGRLRPLLRSVERFPENGPPRHYEWHRLLTRVEDLAASCGGDWCVHHDVDEIRQPPWPNMTLRDGLWVAEQMGFNAVDHTVIDFHPVDEEYSGRLRPETYFEYWDFGIRPGHFSQIKAWKNTGQRVRLADSGGHDAAFQDRKVFPYKFLLRHYPIRNSAQGRSKIFQDRVPRFDPVEKRTRGWHTQYENLSPAAPFLKDPVELNRFHSASFLEDYLVERLSGVGIRPVIQPSDRSRAATWRERIASRFVTLSRRNSP